MYRYGIVMNNNNSVTVKTDATIEELINIVQSCRFVLLYIADHSHFKDLSEDVVFTKTAIRCSDIQSIDYEEVME